jgi:hypothetical protein
MVRATTTTRKKKLAEPKLKPRSTPATQGRSKSRNAQNAESLRPSYKGASMLTALAPELRNRIWEFSLVEDEHLPINIWKNSNWTHVTQPALLHTCRQIRNEAIATWYTSNTFVFKACNSYDLKPYLPFFKQVRKYHEDPKASIQAEICPSAHPFGFDDRILEDLKDWLKLYHAEPDLIPTPAQDAGPFVMMSKTLANQTFGTVQSMLDKPWEAVDMTLHAFFTAIQLVSDLDADYLQDELMEQLHARAHLGTDDEDEDFDDDFETDSDEYDEDDDNGVSIEGMD